MGHGQDQENSTKPEIPLEVDVLETEVRSEIGLFQGRITLRWSLDGLNKGWNRILLSFDLDGRLGCGRGW